MSTAPLPEGIWIRGISIKQPRTTAILTGAKQVENRPQHWSWRTWVLLHASQQIDRSALRLPLVARIIRGQRLSTGAVVGIARITGYHQDLEGSLPCSPWAQPGSWHVELADVQELPLPVPARGQLGPGSAGPGVPAVSRLAAMTRTRAKKQSVDPGLAPAPAGLLGWHGAGHFDR